MESSSCTEFPGFQACIHKDDNEYMIGRSVSLSRLQRRAPRPLQVKPKSSLECKGDSNSASSAASSSSSAMINSFYHRNKDPIPLLSPLVLPCLLESSFIQGCK
ncbi:hypothetical protein HS088_TW02G01019 [Tripterygium wilfordii]|uniref:Uncharacterized protein n=1 Tax=Tripterygium wilfordii TaxID=458696 RepID=A0A7J7E029_TRIWF|nr:hypothetical protein HS088_TW02G01019 [Tripterygium wilfordii]